jgi:hypothetical protein
VEIPGSSRKSQILGRQNREVSNPFKMSDLTQNRFESGGADHMTQERLEMGLCVAEGERHGNTGDFRVSSGHFESAPDMHITTTRMKDSF